MLNTLIETTRIPETHTERYSSGAKTTFYDDIYPDEEQYKETRVIMRIEPQHLALDAIFK